MNEVKVNRDILLCDKLKPEYVARTSHDTYKKGFGNVCGKGGCKIKPNKDGEPHGVNTRPSGMHTIQCYKCGLRDSLGNIDAQLKGLDYSANKELILSGGYKPIIITTPPAPTTTKKELEKKAPEVFNGTKEQALRGVQWLVNGTLEIANNQTSKEGVVGSATIDYLVPYYTAEGCIMKVELRYRLANGAKSFYTYYYAERRWWLEVMCKKVWLPFGIDSIKDWSAPLLLCEGVKATIAVHECGLQAISFGSISSNLDYNFITAHTGLRVLAYDLPKDDEYKKVCIIAKNAGARRVGLESYKKILYRMPTDDLANYKQKKGSIKGFDLADIKDKAIRAKVANALIKICSNNEATKSPTIATNSHRKPQEARSNEGLVVTTREAEQKPIGASNEPILTTKPAPTSSTTNTAEQKPINSGAPVYTSNVIALAEHEAKAVLWNERWDEAIGEAEYKELLDEVAKEIKELRKESSEEGSTDIPKLKCINRFYK